MQCCCIELIHLRRRDVWVNFVQALLQIFYWWHPLVWIANARIRRVREEAVDDAVMLGLREHADSYAPTLLEVAKLALNARWSAWVWSALWNRATPCGNASNGLWIFARRATPD